MKTISAVFFVVLYLMKVTNIMGQESIVYLHTDRSYYIPGESILYKAYFLDGLKNDSYPVDDTLHLTLLDQYGQEVASGISPVNNNMISGNVDLPDFLTEGNYLLIASTHSMNNLSPDKIFSGVIEIRKSFESILITEITLTDTIYLSGSSLTAEIRFSGKDNKPVPASFAYQLSFGTGVVLNGNNKANNEGKAALNLQLPKFDNTESLKLFVDPSYKGTKNITGIVIPTHFNYTGEKMLYGKILSYNESKHLNIQIKNINMTNEKNDKIQLEISVTDDKGTPVMTNLSVSASNIIPHQIHLENDNILKYSNLKNNLPESNANLDRIKYFMQYLAEKTQSPGISFIIQEKNNIKKLNKMAQSVNQKNQNGYSAERNIYDILMQIKPYRMENGKIIFGISSPNSINWQDGALIIVDGIKMGTDAGLLNSIPVPDIARITASTNVLDIQRYSVNSIGIIEIFTKKSPDFVKNEEAKAKAKSKTNTLFWGPDIMTDSSGKASVSFFNNENSTEVLISVAGMTANGVCGSSSIHYTVN